jgi:hypothetical protein
VSSHPIPNSYTSFAGHKNLASGSLEQVALAVKKAVEVDNSKAVLVFNNSTGRAVDIDTRGSEADVLDRLASSGHDTFQDTIEPEEPKRTRGRGRPKLGVVSREVTLLPRHWAWLADQPGGASVALRKLVERARKASLEKDNSRKANERAYNFMSAMAGDLAGFEEAIRALFAGDREKFESQIENWPEDIRQHACWLAFGRLKIRS